MYMNNSVFVIDERWISPLSDAQKPVDLDSPKCLGCGKYHGGINKERNCMRAALNRLRKELSEANAKLAQVTKEVEPFRQIQREVALSNMMPRSKDGSVEFRATGKRTPESFAQG